MQERAKTGFKQRNPDDFAEVSADDIEKYVDLLYEEKYEDKIKGARNLLYLIKDAEIMYAIVEQKPNLLDVVARTLRDEHKKGMELSIYLIDFFYSYSFYQMFHQFLVQRSIGEICVQIIDYNLMKYDFRKDEMLRLSVSKNSTPYEYRIALEKFVFMVRKQDRILTMAFKILKHLAEDPKIEARMVKKDMVNYLIKHMARTNINLLLEVLLFLKKLSIVQQNKDAMVKNGIFEKIMCVFEIKHPFIWAINLQLFFNLSFDHQFRLKVISKPAEFYKLTEFFKLTDFRSNILRIFYNFSLEEKAKPLFYDSDALYIIYELLDKFPEKIIGAELAALTMNLCSYPPNAKKIAENGRIKNLIERVLKNSDFELMKIIKTIIEYCGDDDKINDIYDDYIDKHFMPIILSKNETNEFLIETIYILSYINTDWSEKLEKFKLIKFFEENLRATNYDELLIAVIFFFGNVAGDRDCAKEIAKSKIIDQLSTLFLKKSENLNIVFGIIVVLYQMLPWEETKKLILADDEIIQLVLSCMKCENEQITFVSMRFLEIVQLYDQKWHEKIKKEKFKLYNGGTIEVIKEMNNKIKAMSNYLEQGMFPGDYMFNYDDGYLDDDMMEGGDDFIYNQQDYYNMQ